jgi:hypothetical protein
MSFLLRYCLSAPPSNDNNNTKTWQLRLTCLDLAHPVIAAQALAARTDGLNWVDKNLKL